MKFILKLENVGLFILSIFLFSMLKLEWWWFPACLLLPDLSMAGYIFGNKAGAVVYNLFHHQGIAILVYLSGIYLRNEWFQFVGIILFAHSAMDRIFGYGLKYFSGFNSTHLGKIDKSN